MEHHGENLVYKQVRIGLRRNSNYAARNKNISFPILQKRLKDTLVKIALKEGLQLWAQTQKLQKKILITIKQNL